MKQKDLLLAILLSLRAKQVSDSRGLKNPPKISGLKQIQLHADPQLQQENLTEDWDRAQDSTESLVDSQ